MTSGTEHRGDRLRKGIACLLSALVLLPASAQAQLRAVTVVDGLSAPVAFVHDPVLDHVFYIVEQGGLVRTLVDGVVQGTPFIDLRAEVSTGGERGLLGMAFAPAGDRVFFNFTNRDGHTVVARYRRSAITPLQADVLTRFDLRWPTGERVIRQPFANHNGGHLAFGPDGFLYIALGDGGSANDPLNHAQNPASLLGKVLRIGVDVPDADAAGYRIPADNPFVDGDPIAALPEIWAFGLRNPWRYSFDDFGAGATGGLLIGDVGQGAREEINIEPAGAGGRNYGWRLREGTIATPGVPATAPAFSPLIEPVFDYPRSEGRAVTGGYIYRGTALGPAYRGRYFFGDFVTSRVWSLGLAFDPVTRAAFVTDRVEHTSELGGSLGGVASFARDRVGELYVLTFAGQVLKIVPAGDALPAAPRNLAAAIDGSRVSLSWELPGAGPMPESLRLDAGSSPGAADIATVSLPGHVTSATFAGVTAGEYYIRIHSVVAPLVSGASNEVAFVVGGVCTAAPSAPGALAASVAGRLVTLSWVQATAAANVPTQFVLEAGTATGLANVAVLNVDAARRSISVEAPPGRYFVRIRAVNDCGTSSPSSEILVTVL